MFTADSIPLKGDIPNYDSFHDVMKSLETIKIRKDYRVLLTSWTPPLTGEEDIRKLIREGKNYLLTLEEMVRNSYFGEEPSNLAFCRAGLEKWDYPRFL